MSLRFSAEGCHRLGKKSGYIKTAIWDDTKFITHEKLVMDEHATRVADEAERCPLWPFIS